MAIKRHIEHRPGEQIRLKPVIRELPADLETPVSVYLKLANESPSFLLESVSGGEQLARYSFIGVNPRLAYLFRGRSMEIVSDEGSRTTDLPRDFDPLDILQAEIQRFQVATNYDLPRFAGGFVGYLGYETIQFYEPTVPVHNSRSLPDSVFLLADTLVAFDHAFGRMLLITFAPEGLEEANGSLDPQIQLDALEEKLNQPVPSAGSKAQATPSGDFQSNLSREEFVEAVNAAKEQISAGEIFQVVLSQKLCRTTKADPFDIYRSLRRLNPSPYMFFLNFGNLAGPDGLQLIGASPEMHVRLEDQQASIRPIAGTRPRGPDQAQDVANAEELLSDQKERAEHVMLLDLARNDMGRVSEYGSIEIREKMAVERYSHVMHIVSQVDGKLKESEDAFSLMRATFPAGTVSGAPKIRAMQIIHDLEKEPRGPYAGAVGYFSFNGSMDTCITIRTLLMEGNKVCVQSGAGIVADSDPDREYEETMSKAMALGAAIDLAEGQPLLRAQTDPGGQA